MSEILFPSPSNAGKSSQQQQIIEVFPCRLICVSNLVQGLLQSFECLKIYLQFCMWRLPLPQGQREHFGIGVFPRRDHVGNPRSFPVCFHEGMCPTTNLRIVRQTTNFGLWMMMMLCIISTVRTCDDAYVFGVESICTTIIILMRET